MNVLSTVHICVAGIGGVGSYAAEALSRASIGTLTLIDHAKIEEHNINRQLYALSSTIGRYKVEVAQERIKDISSLCRVRPLPQRITTSNMDTFSIESCDALIDCIDDLEAKVALLVWAMKKGIPIITSVMGASTRLNPGQVQSSDISLTSHCPIAKRVRKRLKLAGIEKGIFAIYSTEVPRNTNMRSSNALFAPKSGTSMGSFSCLPGIFGLTAAQETICNLLNTINK